MNDIQIGDLVIVVKPTLCCGHPKMWGTIHKVTSLLPIVGCSYCRSTKPELCSQVASLSFIEVGRLKKIPPLSELESTIKEKELELNH